MRWVCGLVRGGLFAVCGAGCSTTATITRSDGLMMEGRIQGGTPDSIIVEPKFGSTQEIRRTDVVDIDHPGNVHALVGGLVLGFGVWDLAVSASGCNQSSDTGACYVAAALPAAAGLGILAWGLATWLGSESAAADVTATPLRRPPPPRPPASAAPAPLPPAPPKPPAASVSAAPPPVPVPVPVPSSTPSAPAPQPSESPPVW